MIKKFIISESEKKNILKMYGLISEQNTSLQAEQSFYASTTPERMLNFKVGDRPANSDYGLIGDSNQENFYFKSTFGDILNRSKSNPNEFLSGFKPLNDMTKYLDYLKIGDEEISGTGEKTFSNLSSNTPIVASHNGLLVIARLMNELKYYKNVRGTTYTIGLGQQSRETKRTYFDASVAGNISQNIKSICSIINFYILPTELWKYVDYVNLNDYKNKQKPEIKNIVYNWVNACLVNFKPDTKLKPNDFISQNNLKNIDSLPSLKNKLDSLLSLTLTNQTPPKLPTTANSLWNDVVTEIKQGLVENFRLYLTSTGRQNVDSQVTQFKSIVDNSSSTSITEMLKTIIGKKEYLGGSGVVQPSQTTQKSNAEYAIGKID